MLDKEIPSEKWQVIMKQPYGLTVCTKLRSFQYRLNNSILTTNYNRYKWDPNISELCTFCQSDTETYIHLFIKCSHVKKLWYTLAKWLDHFCYIDIYDIDPYELIFNMYKGCFSQLVNTILLITKQFFYARKCLKEPLNFASLAHKISGYRNLEFISAIKNHKMWKFNQKWHIYDLV